MTDRDLIAPARPERRSRRRILTLKNFGKSLLVLIVVIVVVNFVSEIRGRHGSDYGRLVRREMPTEVVPARPAPQVVSEPEVTDQTAADPMLLSPAAREQYLGVDRSQTPAIVPTETAAVVTPTPAIRPPAGEVAIVGDGTGVAIVSQNGAKARKLQGGIFKP